jgi:3-mercaptopyruvate sulfurtransferase SseA
MMEKGFKRLYVLEGGWEAWERAGFPVEPKNKQVNTASAKTRFEKVHGFA